MASFILAFGFTASAHAVAVKFQWNASTGAVAGYKLYQRTQAGSYGTASVTLPGTGTSGTMEMDPAESRYVAAKAYDSSNKESAFSNEILCHPVTASTGTGGAITPSGDFFVQNGNSVTFIITPNPGYKLVGLSVGGVARTDVVPTSSVSSYAVSGINTKTRVVVAFEPGTAQAYSISVTTPSNGTISPSGTIAVGAGGSRTFTITPSTGYTIADVRVDNVSVGAVSSYQFTNVTANHTISATFSPSTAQTYAITVTTPTHGTVSPSGTIAVGAGGSRTFTISPSTGYTIADVRVDNVSVGAVASYTFTNVRANHTISATFAARTYTIAVTAPSNGSISPTGSVSVSYGSSRSFTIAPASGYQIDRVLVDGSSVGAVGTYSFTNVTANHTLSASFTAKSNKAPVADAGPDQNIVEGRTVTLNGSNSSDSDGTIASHRWTQTAGPAVTLSSTTAARPTFPTPNVGTNGAALTFRLTVTDNAGATATDTCNVNVTWVNQPPIANVGQTTISAAEGASVRLDGSASTDPDDGIASYRWVKRLGPAITLTNASTAYATFTAPSVDVNGTSFTFELTVTDNGGLRSTAQKIVNVTNTNASPKANAGPDQSVSEGEVVTLDASDSSDPDDGIGGYRWTQIAGPTASFLTPTTETVAAFGSPQVGSTGASLTFRLTVTDCGGLQNTDTCVVSVSNVVGPELNGSWSSFTYSNSVATGTLQVRNSGSVDSKAFWIGFYLSTDGKTLGRSLGRKSITSLPAGQAHSLSFKYTRAGLAGQYVIAVLDYLEQVTESSELNNQVPVILPAAASAALQGTADDSGSDGPDLTASWKSMTVSGSMATGSLEVQNVGNVSSRASYAAFYQSTDGQTLGKYITKRLSAALSPGQTQTLSFKCRESLLTDRYVVAVLDYTGRLQETSRLNNQAGILLP
ncbi:MAG: PKD domain-containing protein [Syntrophobacteraceae bacterium]